MLCTEQSKGKFRLGLAARRRNALDHEQSTGKMPVGPTARMAAPQSARKTVLLLTEIAVSPATNTINLHRQREVENGLDDFARDWGVFVERVGGAKAMVAVGDDGLGGTVVPDEKERR